MADGETKHVLIADWFADDFHIEEKALDEHGYTHSVSGIDNLASNDEKRDTLVQAIRATARVDALVFSIAPIDRKVIGLLPENCLLQRLGTGLDNVDLEFAASRGNSVRNTPEYCRQEVAIHAMALLLCLHRQITQTHASVLGGEWNSITPAPLQRLSTQSLGIAGFGRIGRTLGTYMQPLVDRVMYFDPPLSESFDWAQSVDLDRLLQESDLLSLHMPLTPETRTIIAAETLDRMKPTAILVNAARGGLVDANALADALNNGRLAGAAIDVFEPEVLAMDSPLRSAKNILLTSHTGWYSEQSRVDARVEAMQSVVEYLGKINDR